MLPFMLLFLLVYVPIRLVIRKRSDKKTSIVYEILLAIFLIYLAGLLSITVLPRKGFSTNGSINLIPFINMTSMFNNGVTHFVVIFIGNIVMFMPLGFFIPCLWNKKGLFTCITGALFSLFIEITQIFIGRYTDIDDLILNTLGVFLGYLTFLLVKKIRSAFHLKITIPAMANIIPISLRIAKETFSVPNKPNSSIK